MGQPQSTYIIHTDGGSRGNPGEAAYGFVIYTKQEKIFEEGIKIGINTNNVAEYQGVLAAYKWLVKNVNHDSDLHFFIDSQLVVNQLAGRFKIKNMTLLAIIQQIKRLEMEFSGKITYTGIPREQNKEADRMVNLALDSI
jgi:ribonuclease HI